MYLMPGWSAKGAEAFGQSGRPLDPPTHTQSCLPGPWADLAPSSPIMKSFLPFAVLVVLLVFLAGPRPAQASSSLAQSFEQFQKKVKEFTETVVEKTKAAITQIKHSDLPSKTRTWITENIQKVKDKVESTFKKH
ncbi:apolipoprotein C-I isoform X3 [Monodelphis domestica]|uniref:apolipoprotein C-I isoform X3 n=1 Tax=Monodelphis domestica TaxID=13616 RepID=UPI0024E2513A|nr:apolipoprotein C-I isoform X3 [Monodelphis domestica]